MKFLVFQRWLIPIILFFMIGLHIPRSFSILYVALGLLAWLSRGKSSNFKSPAFIWISLAIFSVWYTVTSWVYGFWSFQGSQLLDAISMLLLPSVCFWIGSRLAIQYASWGVWILLSYAAGAVLYANLAIFVSREQWWDIREVFPAVISDPWEKISIVNVRSMEQNSILGMVMLPMVLVLTRTNFKLKRVIAVVGLAVLGTHGVFAMNGRLGLIATLLSFILLVWDRKITLKAKRIFLGLLVLSAAVGAISFSSGDKQILASSLYDERFGLYYETLKRLPEMLWGGRNLRFQYWDSVQAVQYSFDASGGAANMSLLHSVPLDVLKDAGIVPALMLIIVFVYGVVKGLQDIKASDLGLDSRIIAYGWISVVITQWLFQPLIYGDGLLFFMSFFLLGWATHLLPQSDLDLEQKSTVLVK